jgi:8-oxo-dGTP pyrophosphatase MutT (NUDIX family)
VSRPGDPSPDVPWPEAPSARRGGDQVIPRPSGARLGDDPPWHHLGIGRIRLDVAGIADALGSAPDPLRSPMAGTGVRSSAVLAALYDDPEGRATVILTRRAQHLRSHRGEVSFPGGGAEPGDVDGWATAVRESWEEVRLDPARLTRIGVLDHLRTVSGRSYIEPFVASLPDRPELVPDPGEVERILHVPLVDLLAPGVFREERWGLPMLDRPVWFFEIEGDTIWGATAAMLRNLLLVALGLPDPHRRPAGGDDSAPDSSTGH